MPGIFLADGWLSILASWLHQQPPPPYLNVRLYLTDHTPHYTDPPSFYLSNEADFDGYSPYRVPAWSTAVSGPSYAYSDGDTAAFQVDPYPTVGNWVYGYFVTPEGADALVLFAERLDPAPQAMTAAGDLLIVRPRVRVATTEP